jgi:hypothetical protein
VEFTKPAPKPVEPEFKFKVGDIVLFTGKYHYVSANAATPVTCKRTGLARITKVYKGKHPFHAINITGLGSTVYGWVDESDLVATEFTEDKLPTVGDTVLYKGGKHYYSSNSSIGSNAREGIATITKIYNGKHPYHLIRVKGGSSTVWGWCDPDSFTILK